MRGKKPSKMDSSWFLENLFKGIIANDRDWNLHLKIKIRIMYIIIITVSAGIHVRVDMNWAGEDSVGAGSSLKTKPKAWCIPLIPTFRKQRQADFCEFQAMLHEFQDSQSYIEILCLKTHKNKQPNKKDQKRKLGLDIHGPGNLKYFKFYSV